MLTTSFKRRSMAAALIAAMLLLAAAPAWALIRPEFTPPILTTQSETILKVTVKMVGDKNETAILTPVEAIKGEKPKDPIKLDLTASPHAAQGEAVAKMIRMMGDEQALLFIGKFEQQGDGGGMDPMGGFNGGGGGGGEPMADAYIHVGSKWLSLYKALEGEGLELDKIDSYMEGCFAGTTDMLARMVVYIIKHPQPTVPVKTEAEWDGTGVEVGKIAGKVHAVVPVSLGPDLAQSAWIACDGGDQLLAWDKSARALKNVTAARKLTSKSLVGCWGDFNKDGRLDLASYDGTSLSLHTQSGDGTFSGAPLKIDGKLEGKIVGLCLIDTKGQAGLLVSTQSWPIVLSNDGKGTFTPAALGSGTLVTPQLDGELVKKGWEQSAAACLLADFDGDHLADIIQMFTVGGMFYKGQADGGFAKAVPIDIAAGRSPRSTATTGDFDSDGLLDIFMASEDRTPRLWHNLGGGRFMETNDVSGEIAYISKPGGVSVDVGDVNNDGRQDILIGYSNGDNAPQIFFNRGFRSTGHSHALDLDEKGWVPESKKGQPGVCLGDFNGDGANDMVFVTAGGEIWAFYRKIYDMEAAYSIRVTLDPQGGHAGPITVTGYVDGWCQGAWNVDAGSKSAFICKRDPGPVKVKWQFPGGKEQEKTVVLLNKPVELKIKP